MHGDGRLCAGTSFLPQNGFAIGVGHVVGLLSGLDSVYSWKGRVNDKGGKQRGAVRQWFEYE